ncbi:hypothetical protein Cgig2_010983 [Carnegiea gigantea]|uniref:Uncharacterized protein n=1 Tax=Carnegiea gigantea TaxID=171969 RepID=A0A9Q1JY84_9CARY|nr:hypothetical protein Cgig2_010983 [Carnegiea gigantea]
MSTITDAIMRQVSEQVQRAMEVVNSARPLPHFDYMTTAACEPSQRLMREPSPHHTDRDREALQSNQNGRPWTGNHDQLTVTTTRRSSRPDQGQLTKSITASTPYITHSREHPMLRRPPPMTAPPKPHNARKYCFGGQEVNPTGMIHLPLRFANKLKAKNLETDFLDVDVPTAYNIILGRPYPP